MKRQRNFILYWLPESLLINGKQKVESRQFGIYDGQIWHNALQLDVQFDRSKFEAMKSNNVTLGEPYMVIAVGYARGIGAVGSPTLNGVAVTVEPGSGVGGDLPGLHIPLAESALKARVDA